MVQETRAARRVRAKKKAKRLNAIKKVKTLIQQIDRPVWNSSNVWPHRYSEMREDEVPPLGRMFKTMSYWDKVCNPKPKIWSGYSLSMALSISLTMEMLS